MSKPVRVSLFAPAFRKDDYTKIRDRVKAGEDTGADILLGYDHFFPPETSGYDEDNRPVLADPQPDLPNFEPLTALAAGRSPADVEISQEWPGIEQADEYVEAGVGVFNLQGDAFALDSPEGLKNIQEVIAWRDKTNG